MAEIPVADPGAGYGAGGERPLGVTILAILQMLGGIIALIGGIGGIALMYFLPLLGILGAVLLIVGLIELFVGYGLWGMKSWAWTWAMIINILNIILSIVQFDIVGLIIPLIIVIYLNQPDIKSRFR